MMVHVLTSAAPPTSQAVRARQRRYVLAMLARTVCFVAMFALPVDLWVRALFAAAAIFIPYVAVVVANTLALPGRGEVAPTPGYTGASPLPAS